ncbi:MAG: ADP-ribosylation factor-like protein, partial [Candidatus Hodarchaeota archaeon]
GIGISDCICFKSIFKRLLLYFFQVVSGYGWLLSLLAEGKSDAEQGQKIPVVVAGITGSGKTTFVQRLLTGRFVESEGTTLGLDVEIYRDSRFGGAVFQLFDLGGQPAFREMLWLKYIKMSQGVIFIFDSANPEHVEEAREWFWRVCDWAGTDMPILFLANKWDLPNKMDLTEIIERLEITRFSEMPARSFRIYTTSMLTGENVQQALNWFIERVREKVESERVVLHHVYIYTKEGKPYLEIPLTKPMGDPILLAGFFAAVDNFSSFVMNEPTGVHSIQTQNYRLVMVKGEEYICSVVIGSHDSVQKGRIVAESIIARVEETLRATPEEIMGLLIRNFSEDLPPEDQREELSFSMFKT